MPNNSDNGKPDPKNPGEFNDDGLCTFTFTIFIQVKSRGRATRRATRRAQPQILPQASVRLLDYVFVSSSALIRVPLAGQLYLAGARKVVTLFHNRASAGHISFNSLVYGANRGGNEETSDSDTSTPSHSTQSSISSNSSVMFTLDDQMPSGIAFDGNQPSVNPTDMFEYLRDRDCPFSYGQHRKLIGLLLEHSPLAISTITDPTTREPVTQSRFSVVYERFRQVQNPAILKEALVESGAFMATVCRTFLDVMDELNKQELKCEGEKKAIFDHMDAEIKRRVKSSIAAQFKESQWSLISSATQINEHSKSLNRQQDSINRQMQHLADKDMIGLIEENQEFLADERVEYQRREKELKQEVTRLKGRVNGLYEERLRDAEERNLGVQVQNSQLQAKVFALEEFVVTEISAAKVREEETKRETDREITELKCQQELLTRALDGVSVLTQ